MGSIWAMVLVGGLLRPDRAGIQEQIAGISIFFGLLAYHMPAFARRAARDIQLRMDNDALARQLQQALQVVSAQAATDPLTSLPNRRALEEIFDTQALLARELRRPLSVLLLDIDHFKKINDEHGHIVGDETLRAFARRTTEHLRANDVCTRYGGEEFVVVLPCADEEAAREIAERLRHGVASRDLIAEPSLLRHAVDRRRAVPRRRDLPGLARARRCRGLQSQGRRAQPGLHLDAPRRRGLTSSPPDPPGGRAPASTPREPLHASGRGCTNRITSSMVPSF